MQINICRLDFCCAFVIPVSFFFFFFVGDTSPTFKVKGCALPNGCQPCPTTLAVQRCLLSAVILNFVMPRILQVWYLNDHVQIIQSTLILLLLSGITQGLHSKIVFIIAGDTKTDDKHCACCHCQCDKFSVTQWLRPMKTNRW